MVDLQNNLQTILQKLDAIILEIQKISSNSTYIVSTNNISFNEQQELLKDLLHVLNVAVDILDQILLLQDNK